jgi:CRISPR system Cascade subunit CasB
LVAVNSVSVGQQQMPAVSERGWGDWEQRFVEDLKRRCDGDTGAKARLKRSRGLTLDEARGDALAVFYALRPPDRQVELYFLAATLFPLAEHRRGAGDLGVTLRRARTDTNARGLDRRVEVLLDADTEQLAFRLRQAVHFAHGQRVAVDFVQLLKDVLLWDAADRWVQRTWARSYFGQLPARKEQEARNFDGEDAPAEAGDEPDA